MLYMKEPFTYFRIVLTSLLYYGNYFHQTDLKASLEIRWPKHDFSKNNCKNIKESVDSKYHANILHQVPLLVFSPKPLTAKS